MSMLFLLLLFLKISRVVCIICFHPCNKFCSLCVRGRRQHVELLSQAGEEWKWPRVRWGAWESSPSFPSWLHHRAAVWRCSAYLELRRWRSCTLHNGDYVLQTVIPCWLYLPAQTDFGFHLAAFWRMVWKWWHPKLAGPHVTEFTGMVWLPLATQMHHRWDSDESSGVLQLSVEKNRHLLPKIANKPWPKSASLFSPYIRRSQSWWAQMSTL